MDVSIVIGRNTWVLHSRGILSAIGCSGPRVLGYRRDSMSRSPYRGIGLVDSGFPEPSDELSHGDGFPGMSSSDYCLYHIRVVHSSLKLVKVAFPPDILQSLSSEGGSCGRWIGQCVSREYGVTMSRFPPWSWKSPKRQQPNHHDPVPPS